MNLDVVRRYFVLLVTPGGQSVFHAVESISSLWQWRAAAGVAFTAGLFGLVWISMRRAPLAGLGILWFLFALAPAASPRAPRPRPSDGGAQDLFRQRRPLRSRRLRRRMAPFAPATRLSSGNGGW